MWDDEAYCRLHGAVESRSVGMKDAHLEVGVWHEAGELVEAVVAGANGHNGRGRASARRPGLFRELVAGQSRAARAEVVEERCLLAAAWFAAVNAPLLDGESTGTLHGATGSSLAVGDDATVGSWIVQIDPNQAQSLHGPADVQDLLNGHGADFRVLYGLGAPGLVLVQTKGFSNDVVSSALRSNPLVATFEADSYFFAPQGQLTPSDPFFQRTASLSDIHAREAWDYVDSKLDPSSNVKVGSRRVVVGVLDSGIDYTHPDLAENIWLNPGEIPQNQRNALIDTDGDGVKTLIDIRALGLVADVNKNGRVELDDVRLAWSDGIDDDHNGFKDDIVGWDFATTTYFTSGASSGQVNFPGDNDPKDEHYHGTHVAGTIGALANNREAPSNPSTPFVGVAGVSWNVSMIPLRFLEDDNRGSTANAVRALNYAADLKEKYIASGGVEGANIRVTNNSWGSYGEPSPALRSAIARHNSLDILFVAGAGNGNALGQGTDNDVRGFCPASFEFANVISVAAADRSNRLLVNSNFGAQAVDIAAPGLGIYSTAPGGKYQQLNGTSMATPHVTGTIALIASLSPQADVSEIRDAILKSVDTQGQLANRVSSGGLLNIDAAVRYDSIRPRAALESRDLTISDDNGRGTQIQRFTVIYTDDVAVDVSTFGSGDVYVVREGTTTQIPARRISSSIGNAASREARYEIDAVGGSWDDSDNGKYEIMLIDGSVTDTNGNAIRGARLGTFTVDISHEGQLRVDSTIDSVDANPGDLQEVDSLGRRTLRAAIMEANATVGLNTITLGPGVYILTLVGNAEDGSVSGDLDILSR